MKKIEEEIGHKHVEDLLSVLISELNDLKERVRTCEDNLYEIQKEIKDLYKVMVFILRAIMTEGDERLKALEEALRALEKR